MSDSFSVTLDALGRNYAIPTGGATDWRSGVSRYLRDSATVINSLSGGGVVGSIFNVRTYGATGNGVTDDTAAIQAAMAALAAEGLSGGTLYFPAGIYRYTATLQFGVATPQRNVKIAGDGVSSVLKPNGSFSTNPTIEFRDCDYWSIQDVKFDASTRTGTGDTVLIDGSSYGFLTNSTLVGSTRYGVNLNQVSGLAASTGNTVFGNVYATNSTANVFVKAGMTGNVVNEQIGSLPGPAFVDVAVRFGLKADGVTDETSVVQAIYDWAYTEINSNQRLVALQFPRGDILISSTIVVKGNSAGAPATVGVSPYGAAAFNLGNTRFKWTGADNGLMFYCQSFNKGIFQGIHFLGNDKAGCGVHFGASVYNDWMTLAASSGWGMSGCRVVNLKPGVSGNACVKIGTDPALTGGSTYQSSEGLFDRCDFVGESTGATGFTWAGLAADGIKTMSGGNCKNFAAFNCTFNVCADAIDWTEASGNFYVANFNGSNVRTAIKQSDGHLMVHTGDIEAGNVTDFQFLTGSGGGGDCCAEIHGMEALGTNTGINPKIIDWGGALTLRNNAFGLTNALAVPIALRIAINVAAGNIGSLDSQGNHYREASTWAPFYDGSGNALAPVANTYGGENMLRVQSWGDKGGPGSGPITELTPFNSGASTFFSLVLNSSFRPKFTATGSDVTIDSATEAGNATVLAIDATTTNRTVTLPASAAGNKGRFLIVYKSDASANTVTCNGLVLLKQYELGWFVSSGSAWVTLLQPASASVSGTVTTGTQTFGGSKTFASPITYSGTSGITAHAGGGQGSATVLTTEVNIVTTVASGGDSVKLPTAALGLQVTVTNQGANAADIFPVTGGQIDALGTNAAYSLAAGASVTFLGKSATDWVTAVTPSLTIGQVLAISRGWATPLC